MSSYFDEHAQDRPNDPTTTTTDSYSNPYLDDFMSSSSSNSSGNSNARVFTPPRRLMMIPFDALILTAYPLARPPFGAEGEAAMSPEELDAYYTRAPKPPASVNTIDNLEVIGQLPAEEADCSICSEVFSAEEPTNRLPCRHCFHRTCVVTWLKKCNTCPVCRFELPTDDEAYEKYKREKRLRAVVAADDEEPYDSMYS